MYPIELVHIGHDRSTSAIAAADRLNEAQAIFKYTHAPLWLQEVASGHKQQRFFTDDLFKWLRDYRASAKGFRPFIIGLIDTTLETRLSSVFGSAEPTEGLALVSLRGPELFVPSVEAFCTYYLIRFALGFVAPHIKNHEDARKCLFARTIYKSDIVLSLTSNRVCDEHDRQLSSVFNRDEESSAHRMFAVLVRSVEQAQAVDENGRGPLSREEVIQLHNLLLRARIDTIDSISTMFAGSSLRCSAPAALNTSPAAYLLIVLFWFNGLPAEGDSHFADALSNLQTTHRAMSAANASELARFIARLRR